MRNFSNTPNGPASDNPQLAAQRAMRPALPKRFFKEARVVVASKVVKDGETSPEEYEIHLDGKQLKTPARKRLVFPTIKSAQIVANEWQEQEEFIDAANMPATRLANTALDGIVGDPQPVIEDMLKFASSDLLCYRASTPKGLAERQARHWDPVLDWVEAEFDARFETTCKLQLIAQPKEAISLVGLAIRKWRHPIAIGALHTFTNLTGSLLLALAIAYQKYDAVQAWNIAHVDEDWNIDQWGGDSVAEKRRANRFKEMQAAHKLFLSIGEVA